MGKYSQIAKFIDSTAGVRYLSPKKVSDEKEKDDMQKMYDEAISIRKVFNELLQHSQANGHTF